MFPCVFVIFWFRRWAFWWWSLLVTQIYLGIERKESKGSTASTFVPKLPTWISSYSIIICFSFLCPHWSDITASAFLKTSTDSIRQRQPFVYDFFQKTYSVALYPATKTNPPELFNSFLICTIDSYSGKFNIVVFNFTSQASYFAFIVFVKLLKLAIFSNHLIKIFLQTFVFHLSKAGDHDPVPFPWQIGVFITLAKLIILSIVVATNHLKFILHYIGIVPFSFGTLVFFVIVLYAIPEIKYRFKCEKNSTKLILIMGNVLPLASYSFLLLPHFPLNWNNLLPQWNSRLLHNSPFEDAKKKKLFRPAKRERHSIS